jgi:hypothetical protein
MNFSKAKQIFNSICVRVLGIVSSLGSHSFPLFLLAVTTFLISRILYLDRDLPSWTFTFYAPTDEPYYTIPAFNLFHYGAWIHKVFDFLPPDESPFLAAQNLLTYFGLLAFGNNFFGLRAAAVLCGLFVFSGTLWCLRRTPSDDQLWKHLVVASAAVYMIVDFFFLQSNRVNDPTIFMMAGTVVCMLLVVDSDARMQKTLLSSGVLGFAAGIIVTFVYVYMVYVAAALCATLLICRSRDGSRRVLVHMLAFSAGAVFAAALFAIFLQVCFQTNLVEAIKQLVGVGGVRAKFLTSNIFNFVAGNFREAFRETFRHNLFLYNPALLMVYLAALPVFVLKLISEKRAIDVFVATCLVFRLLLSALIPYDYYEKKLIQVFPLVVYVIATAAISAEAVFRKLLVGRRFWLVIYAVFIAFLGFVLPDFLLARDPDVHVRPGLVATAEHWIVLVILPFLFFCSRGPRMLVTLILVFVLLIPSVKLDRKFVYDAPTFQYRDSLIRVAPKLDGKILVGGVSYVMRLYNTSIPTMNFYMYYYYGYDKFATLSKYLFDQKLADGTVLFVPFHSAAILKPTYDYVNCGGLILDEVLDINDVEEKYKFGIFVVSNVRSDECLGN